MYIPERMRVRGIIRVWSIDRSIVRVTAVRPAQNGAHSLTIDSSHHDFE
jgi:hypothetical protein